MFFLFSINGMKPTFSPNEGRRDKLLKDKLLKDKLRKDKLLKRQTPERQPPDETNS